MLDISIRQLEVFVATAEYCSFTKAAEDLHLTQSTVSMHIRTLEEVLGACLIERGARKKVILTEEGKRVYSMAKDILSRVDALQERRMDGGEELLRIGTSTVPAQYLLPKLLSGFLKKHSQVKYILRRGDSEHILECVLKGEVRIGLTGYRNSERSLIFQEIARDHLVLITENSERYRAMQAAGKTGNDLLDLPMIAREESSGTQHAADAFLQRLGVQTPNIVARMDNPESIKMSVAEGIGVSIISDLAVSEEIRTGKLLAFPFSPMTEERKLYTVWPRDALLTSTELRFIQHVKSQTSAILSSE
jgi:DNA-binding transcriptional LysR family regulator